MIQIIISPAKKMNICEEFPGTATTPVFAEQTNLLYQTLKQMSFEELRKLWKCSEKLALQNTKRLCEFTLNFALQMRLCQCFDTSSFSAKLLDT